MLNKTGTVWIIAIIAFLILLGLYVKFAIYDPNMKIISGEFYGNSTPDEIRDLSHRVLKWPFWGAHDAFLSLVECGDESSVPLLINALWWQPTTKEKGVMVCTKSHGLEALRTITNQNAGMNYDDWRKWWDVNNHKTRNEWIINGFMDKGYTVTTDQNDKNIETLFRVIGEHQIDFDSKAYPYLAANALYLLKKMDKRFINDYVNKHLDSEDITERKGIALALLKLGNEKELNGQLRYLMQDKNQEIRELAESKSFWILRQNRNYEESIYDIAELTSSTNKEIRGSAYLHIDLVLHEEKTPIKNEDELNRILIASINNGLVPYEEKIKLISLIGKSELRKELAIALIQTAVTMTDLKARAKTIYPLIEFLKYADLTIRECAGETLKKLTNNDFGFSSNDYQEKKQDVFEKWQKWWKQNKDDFLKDN